MRSFKFIKADRAALFSILLSALVTFIPVKTFAAVSSDADTSTKVIYTGNGTAATVQVQNADNLDTFKGLMPGGSTRPQDIVIENQSGQNMNVYFQAQPTNSTSVALLDALTLTVSFKMDGNSTVQTLYSGPASGKSGTSASNVASFPKTNIVTSPIQLGYVYGHSSSGVLSAVLSAPETMGNAYQSAQADIKWVFQFELTPPASSHGGGGGGDTGGGTTYAGSTVSVESVGTESTPAVGPSSSSKASTSTPSSSQPGENIPDDNVPLSHPPKTGQDMALPGIIASIAAASFAAFLIAKRKMKQS